MISPQNPLDLVSGPAQIRIGSNGLMDKHLTYRSPIVEWCSEEKQGVGTRHGSCGTRAHRPPRSRYRIFTDPGSSRGKRITLPAPARRCPWHAPGLDNVGSFRRVTSAGMHFERATRSLLASTPSRDDEYFLPKVIFEGAVLRRLVYAFTKLRFEAAVIPVSSLRATSSRLLLVVALGQRPSYKPETLCKYLMLGPPINAANFFKTSSMLVSKCLFRKWRSRQLYRVRKVEASWRRTFATRIILRFWRS